VKTIVFGGSFDPLHNGHVAVANCVQRSFCFEEFLWLPSFHAVHKLETIPSPSSFRLKCLKDFLKSRPHNEKICDYEVNLGRPSFTIDTLNFLMEENPERELYFVMGADSLSHLDTWHRLADLFDVCTFLLVPRLNWGRDQLDYYHNSLKSDMGARFKAKFLEMDCVDVNSTALRSNLEQSASFSGLEVPRAVEECLVSMNPYSLKNQDGDGK
jgi:nicotinate-nucleotide adenylyltransferase